MGEKFYKNENLCLVMSYAFAIFAVVELFMGRSMLASSAMAIAWLALHRIERNQRMQREFNAAQSEVNKTVHDAMAVHIQLEKQRYVSGSPRDGR